MKINDNKSLIFFLFVFNAEKKVEFFNFSAQIFFGFLLVQHQKLIFLNLGATPKDEFEIWL